MANDMYDANSVVDITQPDWDGRIRGFRCGVEVDVYVVVTQRFVVFVDTTATPEQASQIREALKSERQSRQTLVINTHADYDHCWGNVAFLDTSDSPTPPIIGHATAREWMRSAGAEEELLSKHAESERFAKVRLVAPNIAYTSSLLIDGGDLTLELLHTPGHTPDHTAVWIPEARILLAGDAAEHPFPLVHEGPDLRPLRQSLARLRALEPVMILPCHGAMYDPGLLARNLDFFEAVERRVRAALAAGLTLDQLSAAPDDDLERLVQYSYEAALLAAGARLQETPPFYRGFFVSAIRATCQALWSPDPPLG